MLRSWSLRTGAVMMYHCAGMSVTQGRGEGEGEGRDVEHDSRRATFRSSSTKNSQALLSGSELISDQLR